MPVSFIQNASLASGVPARSNMPAGSVLQVVQETKTDTFTTASSSWVDITGLSVSITPTSASSRILVLYTVNAGAWIANSGLRILRGSTNIFVGDSGGGGQATSNIWTNYADSNFRYGLWTFSHCYLDSPATTSSTTYKIQTISDGSQVNFINRSSNDSANRTPSSITVMEIAA